jgi:hypothetical protein
MKTFTVHMMNDSKDQIVEAVMQTALVERTSSGRISSSMLCMLPIGTYDLRSLSTI